MTGHAVASEFRLSFSVAFHAQLPHLELLKAGGTRSDVCSRQQLRNQVEFDHSLPGAAEFSISHQWLKSTTGFLEMEAYPGLCIMMMHAALLLKIQKVSS